MRDGQSFRLVEDVVGCKWTVQLLAEIAAGHRRPGRLRRAVAGISPKVMNERLAMLLRYGVLERRRLAERPPHVEYHLTSKGRQVAELVEEIRQFCARWDGALSPPLRRAGRPRDATRVGSPPPPPARRVRPVASDRARRRRPGTASRPAVVPTSP